MDKEDIVTYKQALALKKLGFDFKVNHCYFDSQLEEEVDEHLSNYDNYNNPLYIERVCSAPTLAQVQKWLIEQGLFVEVFFNHFNSTWASSIDNLKTKEYIELKDCATYEEALSIGITQCLKLLENE